MTDHSYKWHEEESNREMREYNLNRMSIIIDKLNNLSREMRNLKKNVHAIKRRYESCNEAYHGDDCLSSKEVKCVKVTESREDSLMKMPNNNSPSRNRPKLEETLGIYLEETLDMKSNIIISPIYVNPNSVIGMSSIEQEIIKKIVEKDGYPHETPTKEPGTFAEKVKRRIIE
ncbi:hypothetical protein Tco_0002367 [Tanacetum coccineum]